MGFSDSRRDSGRQFPVYYRPVLPGSRQRWTYGGCVRQFPPYARHIGRQKPLGCVSGPPAKLALPSAPLHPLYYFEEPDRPQTRLDRDLENGMAISIGRLRPDSQYDYKFACLSHNTLRGAAGGGVLLAELLCAQGYMD